MTSRINVVTCCTLVWLKHYHFCMLWSSKTGLLNELTSLIPRPCGRMVFREVASSSSSLLVLSCCCSILDWIFTSLSWTFPSLSWTVSSRRAASKRISHHNCHRCPVFITDFLTWVIQQEPLENVDGGILPGVELTLNSSCIRSHLCNHSVKLSLADTFLLSCIG